MSHLTKKLLFRRRCSQPICWPVLIKQNLNKAEKHNLRSTWNTESKWSETIADRRLYVRGADFWDVTLEGGHVEEAGVDERLDLSRLVVTQWVDDSLEGDERRMTLLENHEWWRTQLVSLGLVNDHLDQHRVNLAHHTAHLDTLVTAASWLHCNSDWNMQSEMSVRKWQSLQYEKNVTVRYSMWDCSRFVGNYKKFKKMLTYLYLTYLTFT